VVWSITTIHYFIIFCKIVITGTAYAESSFLVGLRLRDFKNLGLRLRFHTPGSVGLKYLKYMDPAAGRAQDLRAMTKKVVNFFRIFF